MQIARPNLHRFTMRDVGRIIISRVQNLIKITTAPREINNCMIQPRQCERSRRFNLLRLAVIFPPNHALVAATFTLALYESRNKIIRLAKDDRGRKENKKRQGARRADNRACRNIPNEAPMRPSLPDPPPLPSPSSSCPPTCPGSWDNPRADARISDDMATIRG